MNYEDIHKEIELIGEEIKRRTEEAFVRNPDSILLVQPCTGLLTEEETNRLHELKMMLPTFAEMREQAQKNIAERIAKRRNNANFK